MTNRRVFCVAAGSGAGRARRFSRAARREEPQITFLLGPARSGTSLLYRALCLHPESTYISNYVRRFPRLPELVWLNLLPRMMPRLQREAWFREGSNAYVYGSDRTFAQRWLPAPVEGEPVFRACGVAQLADEPAKPQKEQVAALRSTFARLSTADGCRSIVSKRISHNLRIPLLRAAFPSARFITLVRDGRAVAASLSKVDWWLDDQVWWYGGTPRQWAAEGRDPWEICARNWVEDLQAIEIGLADVPPAQVLPLRYEDFVSAPTQALIRIAAFAGLQTAEPSWLARFSRIDVQDRNEGWRQSMAPADIHTVEHWQARLLDTFGYRRHAGAS